jgi:hypothetical protein
MRPNCWCIPPNLRQEIDNETRGRLLICVHAHCQMACLSWRNSKVVYFLSTVANPWAPDTWVLRQRKGHVGQWDVPLTPMQVLYEALMRGIDVKDQLRSSYPTLLQSHKWWHKGYCFVIDQSLVNSFILFKEAMVEMGFLVVTRKQFHLRVANALVQL